MYAGGGGRLGIWELAQRCPVVEPSLGPPADALGRRRHGETVEWRGSHTGGGIPIDPTHFTFGDGLLETPRMKVITSLTQVVQTDMARILDHVATYTSH